MDNPTADADLIGMTADIVSAYVSNNQIEAGALAGMIAAVHGALAGTSQPAAPEPEPQAPAVPIKKSITPDYLISLEDGSRYKSLRRHLTTKYGMTPDEYRAKWGLPKDYPMVAPNYAKARSELAKASGLGQGGRKPAAKRGRKPAAK
ncbi:MucR family transcriptional regulator [Brevundimonas abyssalis]|jgi:predicted transcriptional regulator|uniref:Transcriptional regulator n=1 Tax=Brevundimonas abyssalis TAR-001 TaxID=1391729 RepID=A0A8E0KHG3_9CAUL|nr:MucR family transcriptional regulator [Brevundimonas abyssalis]GAD58128.1 transcriptional regulator [Brevundimonas abyssalis TAR-001]